MLPSVGLFIWGLARGRLVLRVKIKRKAGRVSALKRVKQRFKSYLINLCFESLETTRKKCPKREQFGLKLKAAGG